MPLHIVVCIKSVVRSAPRGAARRTPENSELNPFDRPALEAALQLKAEHGARVTALSMGPPAGSAVLAEAQAMGVDRAVLVSDRPLAESDTLVTARVLARAIHRLEPFDLLFFGVRTADSDTGQVGAQTASALNLPFVSGAQEIAPAQGRCEVRRVMDDWQERWRVTLPAALTIDAPSFPPRPTGLAGICDAYEQMSIETWRLAELGMSEREVGLAGSPTRVARLQKTARRRACDFIAGDPRRQVDALMGRLAEKGVLE